MRAVAFALFLGLAAPAVAQEQQAGNEASTNAEETFQGLIAQCDNVDALTLRARIRLLIGRTTDEAAGKAQELLDKGFAECGGGDMETALASLNEALRVADAGVDEAFAAEEEAEPTPAAAAESEEDDAPWWQFWK